jgi:hypothetical protein
MSDSRISFRPASFRREVESVLNEAFVYDIGSYGWLNENDADPELVGHAMWQTDQPSIDHNALFGETPVRRRPQEVEKDILTAGEDFCGVMQISRGAPPDPARWDLGAAHPLTGPDTAAKPAVGERNVRTGTADIASRSKGASSFRWEKSVG